MDVSPELDDDDASYFNSQIGVLLWAVELGRIDITCEVSMMSSCHALPRRGHLEAVMRMFSYLKSHERSRIVFDDLYVSLMSQSTQILTGLISMVMKRRQSR